MARSTLVRAVSLAVLFVLLAGLLVWAGTLDPAPALGDYPDGSDLTADYDRYVGSHVTVTGDVIDADPVVIAISTAHGEDLAVTVTNVAGRAEVSDRLRVFGVVRSGNTVEAENAFVVPRRGLWYTWVVSLLAGSWVLARIVNRWTLDVGDRALRPRPAPRLSIGRDDDA